MWKGHILEVHSTNIQSTRFIKWWNNTLWSLKNKWVWEKDYSTAALFAWDKRALFGNYFDTLIPFTSKRVISLLDEPFFSKCWCNGLLNCVPFTYIKSRFGYRYRKGTSIRQAPVFGTSEHYRKAHGSLLCAWMNYNYTACCWFPTSSNILILPSQFWQIRFESCWLYSAKCRILVL